MMKATIIKWRIVAYATKLFAKSKIIHKKLLVLLASGESEQSALSSSSFHLYLQSIACNHMLNAQQESFIV